MPKPTDLEHFMQLRVSKITIATIDDVIATTPELATFNRCRFIRHAIGFALASVFEERDATLIMEKQQ